MLVDVYFSSNLFFHLRFSLYWLKVIQNIFFYPFNSLLVKVCSAELASPESVTEMHILRSHPRSIVNILGLWSLLQLHNFAISLQTHAQTMHNMRVAVFQ